MIEPASVIARAAGQISCDLAGEAAILSLSDGVYYGLDRVGAFVWNMLDEPRSLDALCAAVVADYDVDAGECRRDVLRLLHQLLERGLVEIRNRDDAR